MARFIGNERGLTELDVDGRRYRKRKDGSFNLSDKAAKAAVREDAGFIAPVASTATSPEHGYRCTVCGFGSWFRTCSKCRSRCEREQASL